MNRNAKYQMFFSLILLVAFIVFVKATGILPNLIETNDNTQTAAEVQFEDVENTDTATKEAENTATVAEVAEVIENDKSAKEETGDIKDSGYFSVFKEISEDEITDIVNGSTVSKVTINEKEALFEKSSYDIYIVTDSGKYHLNTKDSSVIDCLKIVSDNVDISSSNSDSSVLRFFFIQITISVIVISFAYRRLSNGSKSTIIQNGQGLSTRNITNDYKPVDSPNVKLDNVVGAKDLKEQALQYVDILKNPKKYEAMGAKPAKGLLLYGPPGNGKTYLAKAIATEAGVPFFSTCGASFLNKYVGVGPANIRELFKKARASAPCIIFIDEFDALARNRADEDNSERINAVDAFLAEMDGIETTEGVLVIAATNFLESLDEAATRPGRFDAVIGVTNPNKKERLEVLKLYTRNTPLSDDVSLEQWATRTVGCSFAEIGSLINNAAIKAAQRNKAFVSYEELNESYCTSIIKGGKHRLENEETRRMVAWHEAGHALVIKLLTNEAVPYVTNIGTTSGAGGYTLHYPEDDDKFTNRRAMLNSVNVSFGGRIGEEIYFTDLKKQGKLDTPVEDNITVGASGDIRQATQYMKTFVAKVGFTGDDGMIDYTAFKDDETQAMIRTECEKISKECMKETRKLLNAHKNTLEAIADAVFKKEEITEEELDAIIAKCESVKTKSTRAKSTKTTSTKSKSKKAVDSEESAVVDSEEAVAAV